MQIKAGDKVKLKSFNGTNTAPVDCKPEENYWKLISEIGKVVQDPKEKDLYASFSRDKRVCVVFHTNLSSLGLISHNIVPNSLWILEKDLEKI